MFKVTVTRTQDGVTHMPVFAVLNLRRTLSLLDSDLLFGATIHLTDDEVQLCTRLFSALDVTSVKTLDKVPLTLVTNVLQEVQKVGRRDAYLSLLKRGGLDPDRIEVGNSTTNPLIHAWDRQEILILAYCLMYEDGGTPEEVLTLLNTGLNYDMCGRLITAVPCLTGG